ncbi:serine/threonine-protein kinase 11-interacting protein [Anopheles coustani]|uniref:serine/threonine-protein kinase 11-interacting protein n=1 Tax=Anopheles coustani TaxID=139045 RepID=UPI0026599F20|nr:serine/threonine-protein kinase 11-interacting protein [Anopheles coustani]
MKKSVSNDQKSKMDPTQITALAKLLKESGDKVLNSQFKLSLSGSLLRALNDSFSLIVDKNEILPPQSFQVVKPNNAKSDVFRDLQFVYDFVQKTVILSLNQFVNDDPYAFAVDISKFRSLRTLEIQKIPVNQIVGLQHLRSQLHDLACVRSISDIADVLIGCGGDKTDEGKPWRSLHSVNFAYNMLDYVDSSLEFTPWLEVLNLSHNQLVSVSAIRCLPNLRELNLSYNRLNQVPVFHPEAMRKMQVLQISNNFLEDLEGVACLSGSLKELDLSGNFIVDHGALLPLSTLVTLRSVNLLNNPLACHPKHRQATARYLNKATSDGKFVLDNEPLSRYEKTLTGNYDSYKAILVPTTVPGPSLNSSGRNTPASHASTIAAEGDYEAAASGSLKTTDEKDFMNQSVSSQKKLKVRRALISEDYNEAPLINKYDTDTSKPTSSLNLESNREHLETKRALETLRQRYGNDWLKSQAGHMVRSVIGFDPSETKEFESVAHYHRTKTSTEVEKSGTAAGQDNVHKIPAGRKEANPSEEEVQRTSTPVGDLQGSFQLQAAQESPIAKSREEVLSSDSKTTESDYKSVPGEDNDTRYVSVDQETVGATTRDSLNLTDIYSNREEIDEDSEIEDNEVLYHVSTRENGTDLSVVVSDKSIKEKDMLGKTKTRWGIKTLEACERSTSSRITLTFDTMKRDKRERVYEMDPHDCQLLEYRLRNILSKRPLSEMNQRLYKCVVCNAKFSREVNSKRMSDDLQCPECRGGYCIEIKEKLLEKDAAFVVVDPAEASLNQVNCATLGSAGDASSVVPGPSGTSTVEPAAIRTSPSKTSLESSESFNDSSSCSRVSHPGSSCDSNQSVAGSTNSERDRDADLLGNDSDIEVLSNPSQSSIEVLDRGYHPSRKASEERRISSLETINDNTVDSVANPTIPSVEVKQLGSEISQISLDLNLNDTLKNTSATLINVEGKSDVSATKAASGAKQTAAHVGKKGFLLNVNLTESSSSGSVTDSVCTAYESAQGLQVESPNGKSGAKDSMTAASELPPPLLEPTSNASKEPVDRVSTTVAVGNSKADSSVLTSVLGGLFQSTNMLMAKNPKGKSDESLLKKFFEPIRYNYNDFANVDHRLKLYLYQNLFEDANESLKWLVSCIVFDDNRVDEWPSGFDGLFIMSTTKFYVMKKVAAENDDPSTWMKKHITGTINRVGIAQPLPWKIGFKFIISAIGGVHLVLQDIVRTDKLMLFFNENPLPQYCTLDYQPSDLLNGKLRKAAGGESVKMVMVINFCDVLSNDELQSVQLSTLVVTENKLMLTPDITWLNESSAYPIEPKFTQLLTNIVELEDVNELSCRLNYMDEKEDKYETWSLDFATSTAKESTVSTICHLWENIFGVPLMNDNAIASNNTNTNSENNNFNRNTSSSKSVNNNNIS